jgi:hypothetical protein
VDAVEQAVVVEPVHARGEGEQHVYVDTGNRAEGVPHARRDEQDVALVEDVDAVADEHLETPAEHDEQLGSAGVEMRRSSVGACPQGRPVAGDRPTRGGGVDQQAIVPPGSPVRVSASEARTSSGPVVVVSVFMSSTIAVGEAANNDGSDLKR